MTAPPAAAPIPGDPPASAGADRPRAARSDRVKQPAAARGGPAYLRDPDVQLMLRVQSGDEAAFVQLVEKYQNRLIGVFAHLVGDRSVAEDLAQDAFLRIYRARAGYTPTAKFSTWLYRIAHNLASNSRRGKARKKEVNLTAKPGDSQATRGLDGFAPDESGATPSRHLAREELREKVREALGALGERQHMALLLYRFEGMSYADIAETMELTPAAVKSLLARARENLRLKLEAFVR